MDEGLKENTSLPLISSPGLSGLPRGSERRLWEASRYSCEYQICRQISSAGFEWTSGRRLNWPAGQGCSVRSSRLQSGSEHKGPGTQAGSLIDEQRGSDLPSCNPSLGSMDRSIGEGGIRGELCYLASSIRHFSQAFRASGGERDMRHRAG